MIQLSPQDVANLAPRAAQVFHHSARASVLPDGRIRIAILEQVISCFTDPETDERKHAKLVGVVVLEATELQEAAVGGVIALIQGKIFHEMTRNLPRGEGKTSADPYPTVGGAIPGSASAGDRSPELSGLGDGGPGPAVVEGALPVGSMPVESEPLRTDDVGTQQPPVSGDAGATPPADGAGADAESMTDASPGANGSEGSAAQ